MPPSTVNELLCFVATQYDKLDRQNLGSILVDFYSLDELVASKLLLVAECEKINIIDAISDYKKKRLNTKSEDDVKQKVSKEDQRQIRISIKCGSASHKVQHQMMINFN